MVTDYKYTSCWVDSSAFIPSAGFRDKKYDMNVAPSLNSQCFQSKLLVKKDLNCAASDAYVLPENCLENASTIGYQREKLMDLYQGRAMPEFAGGDLLGDWSIDPENATIRRRKVVGKDTIGDIRVTFHVPK